MSRSYQHNPVSWWAKSNSCKFHKTLCHRTLRAHLRINLAHENWEEAAFDSKAIHANDDWNLGKEGRHWMEFKHHHSDYCDVFYKRWNKTFCELETESFWKRRAMRK